MPPGPGPAPAPPVGARPPTASRGGAATARPARGARGGAHSGRGRRPTRRRGTRCAVSARAACSRTPTCPPAAPGPGARRRRSGRAGAGPWPPSACPRCVPRPRARPGRPAARSRVVLPAPFAPMRPTHSPRPTDAVTVSTAARPSKRTDTASSSTMAPASGAPAPRRPRRSASRMTGPSRAIRTPCRARRAADTRTKRKNGAPTQAVTTPMGISAGACTVRAIRSAPIRKAAPPTMATGRMMR